MELDQVRHVLAVVKYRTFLEASFQLNRSQSSLSKSIRRLEEELGISIFERTTRRVLVTSLGEALLPFARDAVLAAEAFNEAASSQGAALSGTMRLGIIPTIAPYLAPILIDGLREALPQMELDLREMVTGDNLDQLAQGRLDAAIIALEDDLQRTTAIPMFDEPLVVLTAAGHPWAGRTDVSPTELDDQPLLLLDEGNCLRDQTLALCQRYGSQPPVAVATTLSTVTRMVAHGSGVTIIPEGALQLLTPSSEYGIARFGDESPMRRMGLVHRVSSSRGADFAQLAELISRLVKQANLPVTPVTDPAAA